MKTPWTRVSEQATWQAFEAEAMPHVDRLFRLAMWLERDRTEAEDLVHETLAQASQSITLPDIPALVTPLKPGEQRMMTFTASVGALQQAAILTVGGVPFQIAR